MGRATMIDRALQFVTPVALVRLLDVTEFGQYRIFWLIVMTVMALAPLGMTRSLLYFFPRINTNEKRFYIGNTLLFLACSGLLCALLVAPWNPLITSKMAGSILGQYIIPVFVFLWIFTSLLDVLPNADMNIRWQANIMIGLSIVRLVTILTVAVATRDINAVFLALLAFVFVKIIVLAYYTSRHYGLLGISCDSERFRDQFRYSLPFGIDGGLYSLRGYSEQWIVALLFKPAQYAVFSIAAYIQPLVEIIRGSMSNILLPKMSKLHAGGDIESMLALNNKGNVAASTAIFPALAFLFVFAGETVQVLFTSVYQDAAPIIQIYIIGMARLAIEITTILLVFRQGKFVMWMSAALLVLSVTSSYLGAQLYGMKGAALGSVAVLYLETFFTFRRASALTNVPVSRLQDWKSIAVILFASCLAALIASVLANMVIQTGVPYYRLLVGAMIFSAIYILLLIMLGYGWMLHAYLGRAKWR